MYIIAKDRKKLQLFVKTRYNATNGHSMVEVKTQSVILQIETLDNIRTLLGCHTEHYLTTVSTPFCRMARN